MADKLLIEIASTAEQKKAGVKAAVEANFPYAEAIYIAEKVPSTVSENPYGILEILRGCVGRMKSLGKLMPSVLQKPETSDEIRELSKQVSAIKVASIESGVIPTYGAYNDVQIFQIRGQLRMGSMHTIRAMLTRSHLPKHVTITSVDPIAKVEKNIAIEESVFSPDAQTIKADDPKAAFPDRAVSLVYDPETQITFIGISRGVPFDPEDVRKTVIVDGKRVRVADNMKQRLIKEGKLSSDGYIMKDGMRTDTEFNVQDPQAYINPDFPRSKQIAEMEILLFAKLKEAREKQIK